MSSTTDWGIMQLNDHSWEDRFNFARIKSDWQYNIECGIVVALNRYKEAIRLGEPNITKATYSGYNTFSNINRYRQENDNGDANY